jgi:hypothetical protein
MGKIQPYPLPETIRSVLTSAVHGPIHSTEDQKNAIKKAMQKDVLSEDEGSVYIQQIEGYEKSQQLLMKS